MKTAISISALLVFSWSVNADTNVEESRERLKTNVENSKHNYEQYQNNADIANKNHEATTQAIKMLKNQKKELLKTHVSIDENQKTLDNVKVQLGQLKKKEQAKITKEQATLKDFEKRLAELKKNLEKRQMNVAAYDKKIREIDTEKKDWEFQRQNMNSMVKQIDEKAVQAKKEKEVWAKKKKSYNAQAKKWKKASGKATGQLASFEKIN